LEGKFRKDTAWQKGTDDFSANDDSVPYAKTYVPGSTGQYSTAPMNDGDVSPGASPDPVAGAGRGLGFTSPKGAPVGGNASKFADNRNTIRGTRFPKQTEM